jgi:ribonuclease HI
MTKTKWYAVAKGRSGPAIYASWDECKAQTLGFSGAIYKSFKTREEAQTFIRSNAPAPAAAAASSAPSSNVAGKKRARDVSDASRSKRSSNHQQQTLNNKNGASQITIHFDGGSRGNPGIAGAGAEVVVIKNATPPIITKYFIRQFCGMRETNNHAEYQGLISGLEHARTLLGELTVPSSTSLPTSVSKPMFNLQVFGDSNLIIQQLRGNWQCKNDNIRPLYLRCQRLIHEIRQIDKNSIVSFDHIYREQNKVADQLANEAMDQRRSWMTNESSGGNDAENNARTMKVGVVTTVAAAAAQRNNKEVIDVDDDSSDHSC